MAEQMKDRDVKKMLELLKEKANDELKTENVKAKNETTYAPSDEDIKKMLKQHLSEYGKSSSYVGEDYSIDDTEEFVSEDSLNEAREDDFELDSLEAVSDGTIDPQYDDIGGIDKLSKDIALSSVDVKSAVALNASESGGIDEGFAEDISTPEVGPTFEGSNEASSEKISYAEKVENASGFEITCEDAESEASADSTDKVSVDEASDGVEDSEIYEEIKEQPFAPLKLSDDVLHKEPEIKIEEASADGVSCEEAVNPALEKTVCISSENAFGTEADAETASEVDSESFEAAFSEDSGEAVAVMEKLERVDGDEKGYDIDYRIPEPTEEFLAIVDENERKIDNSIYFKTDESESNELDAVDITLMMALGGQDELNKTIGFEKIRRAVNDYDEDDNKVLEGKEIYGCDGNEFKSEEQIPNIVKRYGKEKINLTVRLAGSVFFTLIIIAYELAGWLGAGFTGIFDPIKYPAVHILTALQLLFFCAAFSYRKIVKSFKSFFSFSSTTCFTAVALFLLNVINDICLICFSAPSQPKMFHSFSAMLFVISLVHDMFALNSQERAFDVVSESGRKFVLEPYGRFKINDNDPFDHDNSINKESYCIEKAPFVGKYFSRTGELSLQSEKQVISLVFSFSVSFVVMLILILMGKQTDSVLSGFMLTASFTMIASTVFGSDYAFFAASRVLSRVKTAIIGKASVKEYGSCDLIYFDDVDVFDKNSVRTKGLKLYDNNEIYRVLYNAQAVFSKIGGPLKAVFEYATTEMTHSKNVAVKMIASEGVIATVDGNTTVCIGTDSFMKSNKIYPRGSSKGQKNDEDGEDSIMYIALNGVLSAKLYVTYKVSGRFEKMLAQLAAHGVSVGIRSADPNINKRWANNLSKYKSFSINVVKPTVKETEPFARRSDSGIASCRSARSAIDGLIMCLKLYDLDKIITRIRFLSVTFGGILAFLLMVFSELNVVGILLLALYEILCVGICALITNIYIRR